MKAYALSRPDFAVGRARNNRQDWKEIESVAHRLPSLNALRAFECASRLQSFTRASEELGVSPGAISRHVHILEESLGVLLFSRVPRGVELTPIGTRYFHSIREVFEKIANATRDVSASADRPHLNISGPPTLISRWLMPRLPRFHAMYPNTSLVLDSSDSEIEFQSQRVDISIGTEERLSDDVVSAKLFDFDLVPACSPNLVNGLEPPGEIGELGKYTLLHTLHPPGLWSYWARMTGFGDLAEMKGLSFPSSDLAYRAACEGLGIALCLRQLIVGELASSALQIALDHVVRYPGGYFITVPKIRLRQQAVADFFYWLLDEARTDTLDITGT